MKKIVIIFSLCFGVTQASFAVPGEYVKFSQTPSISSNGTRMTLGKCKSYSCKGAKDEFLYIGTNPSGGSCYESDKEDDCAPPTLVCIAGPSVSDDKSGYNSCWKADGKGAVLGIHINEMLRNDFWTQADTIQECPTGGGSKWTKNSSDPKRTPVFVTTDDTVLTTKSPMYMLTSVVGTNVLKTLHIKCIAYVCRNDDKTVSYGCPDGSCKDPCPSTNGNNSNKPVSAIVTPYLNALKTKCGL